MLAGRVLTWTSGRGFEDGFLDRRMKDRRTAGRTSAEQRLTPENTFG
jgi:hypothetical protein